MSYYLFLKTSVSPLLLHVRWRQYRNSLTLTHISNWKAEKHSRACYACIIFDWQWSCVSKSYRDSEFWTAGWKTRERQTTNYFHSDNASQFSICSGWCKHHLISQSQAVISQNTAFMAVCLAILPALCCGSFRCQTQPHAVCRSPVDKSPCSDWSALSSGCR